MRQLNISLHSYDDKYGISIEDYMNSIFFVVDNLNNTYVSYRLWVDSIYTNRMLEILNKHYNTNIDNDTIKGNVTLKDDVYINSFH